MSFDVYRPVYTAPEYEDVHVLQGDSQAQSRSNLPSPKGNVVCMDCSTNVVGGPASAFRSVVAGYADFAGEVAVGVASPAVLAGVVASGVASPAVAGAASSADLADEVAVVAASPAIAETASPAVIAEGVTVDVAPWPMLGRRPWPMLGWRPRPTLLGLSLSMWRPCRCWGGVLGRCWGGVRGRCWGGVPGRFRW